MTEENESEKSGTEGAYSGTDRVPVRSSAVEKAGMYEFRHWPTPQEDGITDPDLIYQWEERVAICTFDGGLKEQEARRVAWEQLARLINAAQEQNHASGTEHDAV